MCVALPARVTWIGQPAVGTLPGRALFGHEERAVDLVLVPEAEVGEYVVVHAGYAIRIVTPVEAEETLRLIPHLPSG